MWSSRLFWKIFLVYAGLSLSLAIGFLLIVASWQESQVMQQVEHRLYDTAVMLRSHVKDRLDPESREALQKLLQKLSAQTRGSSPSSTRMTVIAVDGSVLADSEEDPSQMENHQNRPELRQLAHEKVGKSRRRSPTLGISMFYLALPIQTDEKTKAYVRVAMGVESIDRQVSQIQKLLWMPALGIGLLALVSTYIVVGRIIRPLADLTRGARAIANDDYEYLVKIDRRDELGVLGTAFNRMQREMARRVNQLRQHGDQLATILGSMGEAVIAVDAEERILLVNETCRSLLELGSAEVVGCPLLEVTRCRPLHESVQQTLKNGELCKSEFELSAASNRVVALRVTPLPGRPCPGVVIVIEDITELRRLENLRREFVANVSHELKTPLASIKAHAETLRLGAVNDAEHNMQFVSQIEEQAERLHLLILDILHLARVESGRQAFEITQVPLHEVVAQCLQQYRSKSSAKNITLKMELPDRPLAARADEEGIRTILDNLVDNAIKYTPEGGKVTVRCKTTANEVVIEVEDTGIGISPEDQERVCERFYRVDKARSRELGGTGLGLSIVKHLAQAFGGSIQLSSTVGKGSNFSIRLPLA